MGRSSRTNFRANVVHDDEAPFPRSFFKVARQAEPTVADDPMESPEVGDDTRTVELENGHTEEVRKRKRRLLAIGVAVGLFLVAVLVSSLSFFLVDRGSEDNNGVTATAPSNTTTPNLSSQEKAYASLIQTRMPRTTFVDASSPQSRALAWLAGDSYTQTLNDDNRVIQRFALAVLHFATNSRTSPTLDSWQWLSPSTECGWGERKLQEPHLVPSIPDQDVECTKSNVARRVRLSNDGFSGSIPKEIVLLSSLVALELGGNGLGNTIPSEIGLLGTLELLDLPVNNLDGPLPTEIGLLSSLTELNLRNNEHLSGTLPAELVNLTGLEHLYLYSTNLEGSIPSSLCGTLTNARIQCGRIDCECCTGPGDGSQSPVCPQKRE